MAQELFGTPTTEPSMISKIGGVLGGFGAGVQGKGQAYLADLQTRKEDEEKKRLAAMVKDAKQTYDFLNRGDVNNAMSLIQDRVQMIGELGGDPSDTARIGSMLQSGRIAEAQNELRGFLRPFMPTEAIKASELTPTGQRVSFDPLSGQATAEDVTGFRGEPTPQGYRAVTSEERTTYQIPEGVPARFNISENKPEIISGAAATTNINMPAEQKPSVGREAVDKAYAEDYLQWQRVGRSQAFTNLAAIGGVLGQLERGEKLSGPAIGIAPNFILALTNPEATDARETVQGVVQQNLREILGGQFAQQEAQQLLDRAFNPSLDPSINARRLRRLYNQMEIAAKQRDSMANYFDENESLRGYTGEQPKLSDFYTAVSDFSVDQVVNGFKYLGGDMSDPSSWEEVK